MSQLPMRFIIADDDLMYRSVLMEQLASMKSIECLGECDDAYAVAELLRSCQPELLILDIEMPGLNGLQLVKNLKQAPYVIFISSHRDYALDSFEVDAIDFIVKPATSERLFKAIEKVRNLVALKQQIPMQEAAQWPEDGSFFIKENHAYVRIYYHDILYIESMADFVSIVQENGNKKLALVNLKNMELQLPPSQFVRISRTHIVHKHKITSIDSDTVFLQKMQLPLGKSYAEMVMQSVVGKAQIKRHLH
jgi:two-component system, LytTR family, response regulator